LPIQESRVIATITVEDRDSHSHKARVVGDVMVVNVEQNSLGRKQELLPRVKAQLAELLGRPRRGPSLPGR